MINVGLNLVMGFINLLKYPLCIFIGIYIIFGIIVMSIIIYNRIRYKRRIPSQKGYVNYIKKPSIIKRIFYLAPLQFVEDILTRPQGFFREQGLIIFEGFQGSGKSISMVEYATRLLDTYPRAKCISNLDYKYNDEPTDKLKHWKNLVNYKNGIFGVIVMMDELQNWFSSMQSKNFPPEMLSVVTQNRKNRRVILGTAQNFYMLAKNIRTQCSEVRKCHTILGCVTFVFRKRPIMNSDGDVEEWKRLGMYFYVHTPRLRNSYDTWKVIESLSKSGFKEVAATSDTIIYNSVEVSRNKK